MKKFEVNLNDYVLKFYYKPNDKNEVKKIIQDLNYVKDNYNPSVDFGIFSKKINSLEKAIENTMVSVFYLENEPVGFFYNYLFENKQLNKIVSHQGLFVCNKNTGVDILNSVGVISSILMFNQIGSFYITTMSSTPSVLETMAENIHKAWPCYKLDCQRPPKEYKDIFKFALSQYKDIFLSEEEKISIDEKKFKVKFENTNLDYPKTIHGFPLAKKIDHNLFYSFWINYSQNEMVYMVGEYNKEIQDKNIEMIKNNFNIIL